jgi:hypothetical protein
MLLLDPEHLGRPGLDGAVDAQPGALAAPLLGAALRVGQIDEGLAGEEGRRTNGTIRSTRGLSCGERTRAGSITNPRDCAYSTNAWFSRGWVESALSTIAFMLSGITVANTPSKNAHAASQPATTSSIVWRKLNHTKL